MYLVDTYQNLFLGQGSAEPRRKVQVQVQSTMQRTSRNPSHKGFEMRVVLNYLHYSRRGIHVNDRIRTALP